MKEVVRHTGIGLLIQNGNAKIQLRRNDFIENSRNQQLDAVTSGDLFPPMLEFRIIGVSLFCWLISLCRMKRIERS